MYVVNPYCHKYKIGNKVMIGNTHETGEVIQLTPYMVVIRPTNPLYDGQRISISYTDLYIKTETLKIEVT